MAKAKKHCRDCKHFYVCAYPKKFEIQTFIQNHLMSNNGDDNINSQTNATEVIYDLLVKNCIYFEKDAYANTSSKRKK